MKTELEAMKAAGVDMEEAGKAWAFLNSLWEPGPEGRKRRLDCLRALAELARENAAAGSIVGKLLDAVAGKLPDEANTFRAYYLDGERRPNTRQLARRLFVDPTTVHRHNKHILTAMLAPAFGVYGYFQTERERETAQEAPGGRQETPPGAGEG